MGINTSADDHYEAFMECIDGAISHLSEMVVGQCWKWEDISSEGKESLTSMLFELIKMRDTL